MPTLCGSGISRQGSGETSPRFKSPSGFRSLQTCASASTYPRRGKGGTPRQYQDQGPAPAAPQGTEVIPKGS